MKPRLLYVELKTGYESNGPAWIGRGYFSKTGRTIYFNGKAFEGGRVGSIHSELISGDHYWISEVKKDMSDRHWAGTGKIMVDRAVLTEYLEFIGRTLLPKSRYNLVDLDHSIPKEVVNTIKNQKQCMFSSQSILNTWRGYETRQERKGQKLLYMHILFVI